MGGSITPHRKDSKEIQNAFEQISPGAQRPRSRRGMSSAQGDLGGRAPAAAAAGDGVGDPARTPAGLVKHGGQFGERFDYELGAIGVAVEVLAARAAG